ncbi:zf-HC2 domain-containing protein [Geodermatophilus sabuli]|uniref:Zf-HC2 domain-containing protein n=1 Tax=Geodermatophilus sabuli TaxID=1564158 RepID=A0A7K3W2Y0_9ACTN|nr:zf-HC2 domain-containing protein [Geodermatophilus sabuli]
MSCTAVVPDLGAYVLGALAPEDRRRVAEHLRGCADCRAEEAELAALPGLLALVDPADLSTPSIVPSPDLFDRVSAAAARPAHPTRSRRRLLLVAAALVLLFGGVAAGVATWAAREDGTTVSASAGAAEITVTTSSGGGGTVIDVDVAGLAPSGECRLVAVDGEGREHAAGEWTVDERGGGSWRGWADVDADAVIMVVLQDGEGTPLVRAPL